MAMDFDTLVAGKDTAGSIKRWVNYAELDAEDILIEAQALIFQALRVREMRSVWSPTIAIGDSSKALPTGFLDPIGRHIRDNKNMQFPFIHEQELIDRRTYDADGDLLSGTPSVVSIFDEALQFDMAFDEARTLNLLYFKKPDDLSSNAGTNWLTTRYPHLLRQACIVQAYAFMRNWNAHNTEVQKLTAFIDRANIEADLSYRGADLGGEVPHGI